MSMKKIILLCMLCANAAMAQNNNREVRSTVNEVTVYLRGAELKHHARQKLVKGENTLVFTELAPDIDEKSVQIETPSKDITILYVNTRLNYLNDNKETDKIKLLKDSVEALQDRLTMLDYEKQTLQKEKDLLFKNESIGGLKQGVTMSDVEKSADFYRKRSNDINLLLFQKEKLGARLYKQLESYQNQLNEESALANPVKSEISVNLVSQTSEEVEFTIRYLVASSGWTPKYDIRSEGIDKAISITQRAILYNATGIDWKSVKLKLSTANPSSGLDKPSLESVDTYGKTIPKLSMQNELFDREYGGKEDEKDNRKYKQQNQVKFRDLTVSSLSTEFDIPNPYTVLSDSKPYTVEISTIPVKARYIHYSAPSVEKSAFLLARIASADIPNLISGDANIYVNATYLGKSFLNISDIEDTIDLSLGRDRLVGVAYKEKQTLYERSFAGNSEKEIYNYEGSFKNNQGYPVHITIEDMVPLETSSDVNVSLLQTSEGVIDKATGKITWKLTINPGETKVVRLSYSVKHPKGVKAEKKKFRTISAPSF